MQITVVTQPEPLLTSQDPEVRIALALDGDDRDALVDELLLAAQGELDGPLGWVGICVAEQTVQVRLDKFCDMMWLPGGRGATDVSIEYLRDTDAVPTDLSSGFVVLQKGAIERQNGSSWPATMIQSEAVRITYSVGITDDADPRIRLMKSAIMLHAKMTLDGDNPADRRMAIEQLMLSSRYRIF